MRDTFVEPFALEFSVRVVAVHCLVDPVVRALNCMTLQGVETLQLFAFILLCCCVRKAERASVRRELTSPLVDVFLCLFSARTP